MMRAAWPGPIEPRARPDVPPTSGRHHCAICAVAHWECEQEPCTLPDRTRTDTA